MSQLCGWSPDQKDKTKLWNNWLLSFPHPCIIRWTEMRCKTVLFQGTYLLPSQTADSLTHHLKIQFLTRTLVFVKTGTTNSVILATMPSKWSGHLDYGQEPRKWLWINTSFSIVPSKEGSAVSDKFFLYFNQQTHLHSNINHLNHLIVPTAPLSHHAGGVDSNIYEPAFKPDLGTDLSTMLPRTENLIFLFLENI